MTAPSPKEALEIVENLIRRDPACFNLSDELLPVRSTLRALATFQPDGERREAIARILYPTAFMGIDEAPPDAHKQRQQSIALGKVDELFASGLVQDEAGWRDISTAWKHRRILGCDKSGEIFVMRWKPQEQLHHDKEGWFENHFRVQPVKWMPLPIRSARDGGAKS